LRLVGYPSVRGRNAAAAMMGPAEVIEVLEVLGAAEIPVWLDGGWGIDALVGEQTRAHDDLDLVVARPDCARAQDALAPLGFAQAPEIEPGLPARLSCARPTSAASTSIRCFSTPRATAGRSCRAAAGASTPLRVSKATARSLGARCPVSLRTCSSDTTSATRSSRATGTPEQW
jgi:hypothetical protein